MSYIRRPGMRYFHEEPSRLAFDEATGQQFTEVLSRVGPMRADWVWRSTGSIKNLDSYTSKGSGCESLLDMAVRSVLQNLTAIDVGILRCLPWEIGRLIWKQVIKHRLDSLYVWKIFAGAYSGQAKDKSLRHRRQQIEHPDMDISIYVKHITSTPVQWITHLFLMNVVVPRRELINLYKLVNLGTLTVKSNGPRFVDGHVDDGIIRAWARAATEAGAFTMLRVLACSTEYFTSKTFNHLSQFPVLLIFLLVHESLHLRLGKTSNIGEAHKSGWNLRHEWEIGEGGRPTDSLHVPWESFIDKMFLHSSCLKPKGLSNNTNTIKLLPELQFFLGREEITTDSSTDIFERSALFYNISDKNDLAQKRKVEGPISSRYPRKRTVRASRTGNISNILASFDY